MKIYNSNMLSKCRICGHKELENILETNPMPEYVWPIEISNVVKISKCSIYRCLNCHHLQLQNFSEIEIARFYQYGSYVEENMSAKEQRLNKIFDKFGEGYFTNKKILDVGGGSNPFVKLLKNYSKDLFVSDFDIPNETMALCNGQVFRGMFEYADIPLDSFDTILSFHSMEHMNNPALVVSKMRKLLKQGGHVIVEVPNIIEVVKTIPYFSVFHQHINMFTRNSLINLFHQQGFKLESVLQESLAILMVFSSSNGNNFFDNVDMSNTYIEEFGSKMNFLNTQMQELVQHHKPKQLGVYGAGGSTTLLLHHVPSLKNNMKLCFDRDTSKQGKYVPGTNVKVEPPEKLIECDFVIFLTDEIKSLFSEQLSIPNYSIAEMLRKYSISE